LALLFVRHHTRGAKAAALFDDADSSELPDYFLNLHKPPRYSKNLSSQCGKRCFAAAQHDIG
jgi:hypothetical protein